MPASGESCGINVVGNICRLSSDLLAEACQHILSYLQGKTSGVDSAEISDSFLRAGVKLDRDPLQDMIRFLVLTFRSAGRSDISADELVSRLEEADPKWSKSSLQVLRKCWAEHGASVRAQQEARVMLSVGHLVDLQWKLGMAVSSDVCRSLNSPYVTLLLKIAKPCGQIIQRSLELTIPQFQNFHKQFKEIAAVMETV